MNLVDSSVWLALALSGHACHEAAADWLSSVSDAEPATFCRATQQSFLRLLTTKAVFAPYGEEPLTNEAAWRLYIDFLADKRIAFLAEPPGVEDRWQLLAARPTASPKLWMDAYLAAFALAGGHKLVTLDGDYRQFEGLDLLLLEAG